MKKTDIINALGLHHTQLKEFDPILNELVDYTYRHNVIDLCLAEDLGIFVQEDPIRIIKINGVQIAILEVKEKRQFIKKKEELELYYY